MSLYRPVKLGGNTVAVAMCDRCRFKVDYDSLSPDPNFPGLRVCPDCKDNKDPYKLPARKTEVITLRHPRPDEELV
jgi:hypothetical protein